MKTISVGVVGATGAVGEVFLDLIDERNFPAGEIRLFASENSKGKTLKCRGHDWPVQQLTNDGFNGLDVVFFSSGDDISLKWAPIAAKAGAMVIDNSAAFRMNADYPLIVPEVNGHLIPDRSQPTIIANPNCSTIQLVVALQPLAKRYGLSAVRVASYQSVSGAGRAGVEELLMTTRTSLEGEDLGPGQVFPAPIAFNCIPQIGRFGDDGFSTEETKIMKETRKILGLPDLYVSAFAVRVPTLNAHAEAAWVTLSKSVSSQKEIEDTLTSASGIELGGLGEGPDYPTQRSVSGRDPVFVGRIRRDPGDEKTWLMWIVADNVRKGAALNGIQIAEKVFGLA